MSGNPFGLSGISHYGTMQRVGGKAAGFINKKFFHPSSLRNQEKLWLAMSADDVEQRKQDEMDKRRAEERQVETLRKQMYLAGQATKGSDFLSMSSGSGAPGHITKDQKLAFEEQQRRKALLKQERLSRETQEGEEADEDCDMIEDARQAQLTEEELLAGLAKSCYKEDVHVKGHSSVWGSWFETEDKRWGFGCCKTLDRNQRCPLAPEEEDEKDAKAKGEPRIRGKRRRKGKHATDAEAAPSEPAGSSEGNCPQIHLEPDSNAAPSSACASADTAAEPGTVASAETLDESSPGAVAVAG